MDILRDWVRSLVCYLCFIQIIDQILPDGSYRKYVRFFCGLLLIILTVSPFMDAAGLSEKLEQEWRMSALKDEWASLNMEQEGLLQLRRQTINQACREEIERQIAEVAKGNGVENAEVAADFGMYGEETLQIEHVYIGGSCREDAKGTVQEAVLKELSSIYQIDRGKVDIDLSEAGGRNGR